MIKADELAVGASPPTRDLFARFAPFLLGLLYVSALLLLIYPLPLASDEAEVLLQMRPGRSELSGKVLFHGRSVDGGTMQLSIDRTDISRHIGSVLTDVGIDGTFHTSAGQLADLDLKERVHVRARFMGLTQDGRRLLSGEARVYPNCPTPFTGAQMSRMAGVTVLVWLLLIYLFTGEFTRRKAQGLFAVTYLFTFLSVALPIAGLLFISQNRYVIEMMQESPFGLVRAKTRGVENQQWLLNVGGLRTRAQAAATQAYPPQGPQAESSALGKTHQGSVFAKHDSRALEAPLAKPQASLVRGASRSDQTLDDTTPPWPTGGSIAGYANTPEPHATSASSDDSQEERQIYEVKGGLAIPFFVIILAVFGAGINMMRRVPKIQAAMIDTMLKDKEQQDSAVTPEVGGKATQDLELHKLGCSVRRDVIDQYMYLMSAPFLAIAVYYLLQVIATSISEPVLVLMSFSAGLASEHIVSALIDFAEKTLATERQKTTAAIPQTGK